MKDENTLTAAESAKQKLREHLAGCAQVRGIGLKHYGDTYAIKLNLSSKPDDLLIPDHIDGVPVVVDVVGKIKPR